MELRHLRLIAAVSRNGTLSSAGRQLHLTQSALSHQLKEVERELGTELFHRINRKLVLSSAGKIMLRTADHVLAELDKAKEDIKKEICGKSGTIHLSTHCYTCYHWLPQVLTSFARDHQNIEIEVHPEYTREPFQALLDNTLDLIITNLPEQEKHIAYRELFWDQQLLVVSSNHPWAAQEWIDPQQLSTECLIIYYGPLEETTLHQQILAPNNIRPKKVLEMQLTEAAIEMIKNGLGVKVMASWAIRPYLDGQALKAIPISRSGIYRTWYLAYRKSDGWKDYFDVFRAHLLTSMQGK